MPELRGANRENIGQLLNLKVREDQENLVAPNAVTLAQSAYDQPGSYVWGIWDNDKAVGLIAMVHPQVSPFLEPEDDPKAAYLWRLMVAADQQGKGYGRFAVEECIRIAREWGLPRLASSVVDSENSNMEFYEGLGFRQTGAIVDDELVIVMDL